MYIHNQSNADRILLDLLSTIQNFSDSMYTYLDHIGEQEVLNPFQKIDFIGIREPIPNGFFTKFGIRRLIVNPFPKTLTISNVTGDDKNSSGRKWNNIINDTALEELKTLFRNCVVIQFAQWENSVNASDFWDGLLRDVIKPLNKKDFHFIFYLGDPTKKLVFETDEILDIMSEYSLFGSVTLVLNEDEADRLSGVLNEWTIRSYSFKKSVEKYVPVFNTIRIDSLVIFSPNRTLLISKDQRLEFGGRSLNNRNAFVGNCFDAGYQLGLLLQLKVSHCVALGLAIAGVYQQTESEPDQKTMLRYIKEWIDELKTPAY